MSERNDCAFYSEIQDMNATVPCCDIYGFGNCKCFDCKKYVSKSDRVLIVRCKDCIHSIKGGVIFDREYICVPKSGVTHLEEHEANYFCADGERREEKT